jgi:hypothetical protein
MTSIMMGCGDSGQISKEEFASKAGAVCERTSKRIETDFAVYGRSKEAREVERAQQNGEMTSNEAAARVAEGILLPAMRRQFAELRRFGTPSEGGGQAEALLTALAEGIAKAEARPERAARDGTDAFGKWRRLAREFGIDGC